MIQYTYKARNNAGKILTGTVKARNEVEADRILAAHQLVALDLVPGRVSSPKARIRIRVKSKDRAIFARQLSTMVSAGLQLPKALKVISSQTKNDAIKSVYIEIYKDLEEGYSFSSALSKHPSVFDRVFVSVINAGEATGKLDVVLAQLADQLENDNDFIAKVRGALYYPGFILCALVAVAIYMLVAVVPQLKGIFTSAGAQLPLATRALIGLADFIKDFWWLFILFILGLVFLIRFWVNSRAGSEMVDNIKVKVPPFNHLFEGVYMYRFNQVMSMLIGAGVPLLDALKVGASVINNNVYEKSIKRAITYVEKGVPLSVQLAKDPIFPALVGQMAAVGEETGQLDKVLSKVADYYGEETDQSIKSLATIIEPAILILIGLAVAFLVFAVLVPIYNIAQLQ